MPVHEAKLNLLMERIIGDLGAAFGAALVVLGDKLGLCKAMAGMGPMTPIDLARKTKTAERDDREWLKAWATAMGVSFGAVAGIMVYISLDELLTAAREYGHAHEFLIGLFAGMALMAASLVLLR